VAPETTSEVFVVVVSVAVTAVPPTTGVNVTVVELAVAGAAVKPEPLIVNVGMVSPTEVPGMDREVIAGFATTVNVRPLVVAETPPVKLV